MSKRSAEEAGATDDHGGKRRLIQMHLPQMPGAWPEDDRDFPEYVVLPAVATSIKGTFTKIFKFLNPFRAFKTPTSPTKRLQKIEHRRIATPAKLAKPATPPKPETPEVVYRQSPYPAPPKSYNPPYNPPDHQERRKFGKPRGWSGGAFRPAASPLTPIRPRQQNDVTSAKRWSPYERYQYKHGVTKHKNSILRSAKKGYKPFENTLDIASPDGKEYENITPPDEDGDNAMLDVDQVAYELLARRTKVQMPHIVRIDKNPDALHKGKQWNTTIMQRTSHRLYNPDSAPTAHTGSLWTEYRNPEPHYDPDESFVDSPAKPAGFNQEQNKSPTKQYQQEGRDKALPDSKVVGAAMERWFNRAQERDREDSPMAEQMVEEWNDVETKRQIEEELGLRRKLAAERLEKKRLHDAEVKKFEELALEAQQAWDLARKIAEANDRNERALQREASEVEQAFLKNQERKDRVITEGYDSNHMKNSAIRKALELTDGNQMVIPEQSITRHDLGRLFPTGPGDDRSGWLNDAIVNTALLHLINHANKKLGHDMAQRDTPAPFWAFNSGWVSAMSTSAGIKRWAAKRGVNYDKRKFLHAHQILFPVCINAHWTITILYPQSRTIETLNSMNNPRHDHQIEGLVRKFLADELQEDYLGVEWQSRPRVCRSQENASDCGVFTILHAVARVANIPTWAMNKQVCQPQMAVCRSWIGGLLFNGGFSQTNGPFRLAILPDLWDGAFICHPNWCHGGWPKGTRDTA